MRSTIACSFGGKIGGFISKLVGGGGSGVARWSGDVSKALSLLGLPQSLAPQVLYQMQTESGGNPNAINLTDVNARAGDPSRGLLQTIGSTFAAYHVGGTSSNIYDPLANIAAAINVRATWYVVFLALMSGGPGVRWEVDTWYDSGGWLRRVCTWMAINSTGRRASVVLNPAPQYAALAGGSGNVYNAHFDSLTGAAIESHVRSAFQAMAITSGNLSRNGRRT